MLLVVPTEVDACLLGLLLVFLPSATIFNEEFRGKVDRFLQRTGLDKIQEGGGFFERLQEGFSRLQNGEAINTSLESPTIGNGYKNMNSENEIYNPIPGYNYQTPQNGYSILPINTNLATPATKYQPIANTYQTVPSSIQQPQVNKYPDFGGNYQATGFEYKDTIYQSPSNLYRIPVNKYQTPNNNHQIERDNYQTSKPIYQSQENVINNQASSNSYQAPINRYQSSINSYNLPKDTYSVPTISVPGNLKINDPYKAPPVPSAYQNQVPKKHYNQPGMFQPAYPNSFPEFNNNHHHRHPANNLKSNEKIAHKPKFKLNNIMKKPIETPMNLISGFMQKMKEVGAKMKNKKPPPSKPNFLPSRIQTAITVKPENYMTNFEEFNSVKNDLFDLAEISEKELLAYSRVQAMLRKFEQEQLEKEETKVQEQILVAKPAPLANPFNSMIENSNRRSDEYDIGDRRASDDLDEAGYSIQLTVRKPEFPNIFNLRKEMENDFPTNDFKETNYKKLYLVERLEKSDLTDDELVGYLKVQQLLDRIARKL